MKIIWETLDGLVAITTEPTLKSSQAHEKYARYRRVCRSIPTSFKAYGQSPDIASTLEVRNYRLVQIKGSYWADEVFMSEYK